MELSTRFMENEQVVYVIDCVRGKSKSLARDVILAFNLFADHHPIPDAESEETVRQVYLMCRYTDPEAKDIIAMLLFGDYLAGNAGKRVFMQFFSEKRYEWYHDYMTAACSNARPEGDMSRVESVRAYIVSHVCDRMFENTMKRVNKSGVPNSITVSNAYAMVRNTYGATARVSGEPYLVRAIRVATILAEIGVDGPVLAAAILHEAVESGGCTLKSVHDGCGAKIAQYEEALLSVHRDYFRSHGLPTDPADMAGPEARSFDQLVMSIASDSDKLVALYIQAAERIHALRMADAASSERLHNESDELQLDYLPLLRAFKLTYFVQLIEDLVWRATAVDRYTDMEEAYHKLVARNRSSIDGFKLLLQTVLSEETNRHAQGLGTTGYVVEVVERDYLPYEIFRLLEKEGRGDGDPVRMIGKRNMPLCDLDIILDPQDSRATAELFVPVFAKVFEKKIAGSGRVITNCYTDEQGRCIFEIEDLHRNVFRCRISLREDYIAQKFGPGMNFVPEDCEERVRGENINIQLRNGKKIPMPKGATVMDVAFAIHPEIGLSAKSATINGRPASIYNTLVDGDKVIVEADTYRRDGVTKSFVLHARISWLNVAVTKRARKTIMEYLSLLYEDTDPCKEVDAPDPRVEGIADAILEDWGIRTDE